MKIADSGASAEETYRVFEPDEKIPSEIPRRLRTQPFVVDATTSKLVATKNSKSRNDSVEAGMFLSNVYCCLNTSEDEVFFVTFRIRNDQNLLENLKENVINTIEELKTKLMDLDEIAFATEEGLNATDSRIDPTKDQTADAPTLYEAYGLTQAERNVVDHLRYGLSVTDIADATNTKVSTVRTHLHRLFQKTGTARQAELVVLFGTPVRDSWIPDILHTKYKVPEKQCEARRQPKVVAGRALPRRGY
jgi:DNA-binding CsgD family transcriptional regulator